MTNWREYFEDWSTSRPASEGWIGEIETYLDVRLPEDHRDLLRTTGGGDLAQGHCFLPGSFSGGWSDGVLLVSIFGNGDRGMSNVDDELGSKYLTAEWGYPDVGMVLGLSASGGHDALLYNFRHPDHPRRCGAVLHGRRGPLPRRRQFDRAL